MRINYQADVNEGTAPWSTPETNLFRHLYYQTTLSNRIGYWERIAYFQAVHGSGKPLILAKANAEESPEL